MSKKVVTLSISSQAEFKQRMLHAFKGKKQGNRISFASYELFRKTITENRWNILRALIGHESMTVREVADLVGRDVKAVHTDLTVLINAGVIERDEYGVIFPYDDVHVDFTLSHAA